MASSTHQQQQQQGLPSISSLTNGLPSSKQLSPGAQARSEQLRDSGTWPHPHSKRECSFPFMLFACDRDEKLHLAI